jgi:hypothetical protein
VTANVDLAAFTRFERDGWAQMAHMPASMRRRRLEMADVGRSVGSGGVVRALVGVGMSSLPCGGDAFGESGQGSRGPGLHPADGDPDRGVQ